MENRIQSAFENCKKNSVVLVSTDLGYGIYKSEGEVITDYKCLAKIMGLEPEKVKNAYYNESECGAIFIRENGAELLDRNSGLEDILIFMVPERGSQILGDKIISELKNKTLLIAMHRNAESDTKLDLLNKLPKANVITEYSHVSDSPLYGSFVNILIDLYGGKTIREEDYVRLVASISRPEIPNWIPEITKREE